MPKSRIIKRCSHCGRFLSVDDFNYMIKARGIKLSYCRTCDRTKAAIRYATKTDYYTPLRLVWKSIKQRCYNPNDPSYIYYGARGIGIFCPWYDDFDLFKDYIGDPPEEGLTLDRIDNGGNYEPGNLRWATWKEQAANRRAWGSVTRHGKSVSNTE